MMITGMYMAILNNTVHLVQVSCLIERGLGNPIMKPRRRRITQMLRLLVPLPRAHPAIY
jgi:hypothetical protein